MKLLNCGDLLLSFLTAEIGWLWYLFVLMFQWHNIEDGGPLVESNFVKATAYLVNMLAGLGAGEISL